MRLAEDAISRAANLHHKAQYQDRNGQYIIARLIALFPHGCA
jgi:hypothetical protein